MVGLLLVGPDADDHDIDEVRIRLNRAEISELRRSDAVEFTPSDMDVDVRIGVGDKLWRADERPALEDDS